MIHPGMTTVGRRPVRESLRKSQLVKPVALLFAFLHIQAQLIGNVCKPSWTLMAILNVWSWLIGSSLAVRPRILLIRLSNLKCKFPYKVNLWCSRVRDGATRIRMTGVSSSNAFSARLQTGIKAFMGNCLFYDFSR